MKKDITLKEIVENGGYDTTHSYDSRQKGFCEEDINALFEMFGVDEHIDEFIESEFTSIELGGLIAARVALDNNEYEVKSIEFDSSGPNKEALNKHSKYVTAIKYELENKAYKLMKIDHHKMKKSKFNNQSEKIKNSLGEFFSKVKEKKPGTNEMVFIKSIVFTTSKTKIREEIVNLGPAGKLHFLILPYYAIDGDEQLELIKNKIKHNIPINGYDVIFLTIGMKTKYLIKTHEMLYELAKITKKIKINKKTKKIY